MKWKNPLRVILLVAAIIFSALNPSRAQSEKPIESGNDFLLKCSESWWDVALATSRKDEALFNAFINGYCLGVVNGVRFIADATSTTTIRSVCIPEKVTDGQAMKVVLNFLHNNPARTHEGYQMLILNAFHDAWPCKN